MKKVFIVVGAGAFLVVAGIGYWGYTQGAFDEQQKIISQISNGEKIQNITATAKIEDTDLCVGRDGIGTVAPLDQTKVITDRQTGMKLVRDQILVVFKDGVESTAAKEKVASINGAIIGCMPILNTYQIRISGNPTLDQLKVLVDRLNDDPIVEAASLNSVAGSL